MPAKNNSPLPLKRYDLTEGDKASFRQEVDLGFLKPGDHRLNEISTAVKIEHIGTDKLQKMAEKLNTAASGQRIKHKGQTGTRLLVGVAAPQIGIMQRVILVDTRVRSDKKQFGQLICLINPEIIWRSRETSDEREGCFSTGPIRGLVLRPVAVKVRAYNLDGRIIERVFEGYTSHIVQHEIDHLNGIRFPDRIKSPKKCHWVHDEELVIYPKKIRNWKRLCSKKRWEDLKNGKGYI
jgi:peptide deformylase